MTSFTMEAFCYDECGTVIIMSYHVVCLMNERFVCVCVNVMCDCHLLACLNDTCKR